MNKSANTIFEDINSGLYSELPFNYFYAKKNYFEDNDISLEISVKSYNTIKAIPKQLSKPISRIIKKTIS